MTYKPSTLESRMKRCKQGYFAERFEEKLHGAIVHCANPRLISVLGGDKNDRDAVITRGQLSLQIEPARSRQAHIKNQAIGSARSTGM